MKGNGGCRSRLSCQDHRQALWPLGANRALDASRLDLEHLLVKEEQGAEGLVLRRGRDLPFDSQVREEGVDLGRAHLPRMTLVVEEDEALDPSGVGVLGADAVVADAAGRANLVEQPG